MSLPPPPLPGLVPPIPRTVYVVTHPQAQHHVAGLVGGHHDSALTEAGRGDAVRIGRTLRARIPEGTTVEVVASDLLRTRQTAAVVADALASTVRLDRRLREKSYGTAEGREQAFLDARFVPPPPTGDRLRHDEGVTGSETRLDLGRRVYAATTELLGHEAEHQVVITHGFAATFVVAAWIGMPLEASGHVAFHVRSGSISVLREDAFFHNRSVVSVGETSHLAQP